ncbi:hypothetical protein DdX_14840 [Ditylenchus destructor]|uniref:C2H2-type domain-containing protein n=1 Tax=Ditylenchus destructor TaxID=166010 RepID=A0AAD4MTP5_9BILA|nr:hypothetical protein DdX_14840 [Ditylenchus destructor]
MNHGKRKNNSTNIPAVHSGIFCVTSLLKSELRDVNSNSNTEAIIHYSMGLYKCNRCSYDSTSFKNAQVHMRIHSDRLRADSSKRNYVRSNLTNCPGNVVSTAEKSVVPISSSSYPLSVQSHLNESVNDSVHMRTERGKKYNYNQFPYANVSFRTLQMQMRTRSDRHRYSISNNHYSQPKTNSYKVAEKVVSAVESALSLTTSPLSSLPSANNLQEKATNQIINDIGSIGKPAVSVDINDIVNTDFYDVENTEDLDNEQANKGAMDMLPKSSIIYENLCYADYTEDDFDFNFDVDVE